MSQSTQQAVANSTFYMKKIYTSLFKDYIQKQGRELQRHPHHFYFLDFVPDSELNNLFGVKLTPFSNNEKFLETQRKKIGNSKDFAITEQIQPIPVKNKKKDFFDSPKVFSLDYAIDIENGTTGEITIQLFNRPIPLPIVTIKDSNDFLPMWDANNILLSSENQTLISPFMFVNRINTKLLNIFKLILSMKNEKLEMTTTMHNFLIKTPPKEKTGKKPAEIEKIENIEKKNNDPYIDFIRIKQFKHEIFITINFVKKHIEFLDKMYLSNEIKNFFDEFFGDIKKQLKSLFDDINDYKDMKKLEIRLINTRVEYLKEINVPYVSRLTFEIYNPISNKQKSKDNEDNKKKFKNINLTFHVATPILPFYALVGHISLPTDEQPSLENKKWNSKINEDGNNNGAVTTNRYAIYNNDTQSSDTQSYDTQSSDTAQFDIEPIKQNSQTIPLKNRFFSRINQKNDDSKEMKLTKYLENTKNKVDISTKDGKILTLIDRNTQNYEPAKTGILSSIKNTVTLASSSNYNTFHNTLFQGAIDNNPEITGNVG